MSKVLQKKLEAKRGPLKGLYKKLLIYPELLEKFSDLGGFLRFEGVVETRCKKYLILLLATIYKARPVWETHVKEANLSSLLLFSLQRQEDPLEKPYTELYKMLFFFLEKKPLPEELLQELQSRFGEKGVYELLLLLGFYQALLSSSRALSLY